MNDFSEDRYSGANGTNRIRGEEMELLIDNDVKAVAEFMQRNMAAAKLVSVASAIAALAPILWGQFEAEDVAALRFTGRALNALCDLPTQSSARSPHPEPAYAGDGSAVAVDVGAPR